MNRRDTMLALLAIGAATDPFRVHAHAPHTGKTPKIGVLWHAGSAEEEGKYFGALLQGFRDLGYVDGKNIAFEHRFPAEQYDRFNGFAAELVQLKVDAIVAVTRPAAAAAQRATATIPIVFLLVPDPVGSKFIDSFARLGRNITGLSNLASDLTAKRLALFKETVVGLSRVALLVNPSDPEVARRIVEEIRTAAALLKVTIEPVEAREPVALEQAFSAIARSRLEGVVLPPDGMFFNERSRIAKLAIANRLPTIHVNGDTVDAGLLMSYGPNNEAIFRRAATHVDKIIKGIKPGDIPAEQPTKLELVINMKTAKALGLKIPQPILIRADRVID